MDNESYLIVALFEGLGLLTEAEAKKLAKELVTTNTTYYVSTYDAIHRKVTDIFEHLEIQGFELKDQRRKVDTLK